jgi:eukaryotic-like serine/threonine-protein kinase
MSQKLPIASLRFGDFRLNLQSGELYNGGIRLRLPRQSFKILAILLDHPEQVVAREELRKNLWPADTFVDFEHSVNSAVKRLREALNDTAENPRFIETLPRLGYRYIGPAVERLEPIAASPEAAAPAIATEAAQPLVLSAATKTKKRHAAVLWLAFGFSLLLAALIAFNVAGIRERAAHLVHPSHRPSAPTVALAAVKLRPSVAVLGFQNLSGRPDQAWLSTALAEMLSTELGAGGQLRIIPGETVSQWIVVHPISGADALSSATLAKVQQGLNSDYVILGSYTSLRGKKETQFRLDLRLQNTRSGETVASLAEAGSQSQLFEIVSQGGLELRQHLGLRPISQGEAQGMRAAAPSNPEAAQLYAEGLAKLRLFDALAARDLLTKAVAAEPDYPLAHAALADAWSALGYDGKSKQESKRAFELSSKLPREERLLVEARYRKSTQDWDAATKIYLSLFTFFPDNVDYGLLLADSQSWAGNGKEALATLDSLARLPLPLGADPRIDLGKAEVCNSLGDWDNSRALAARAIEKSRAAGSRFVLAHALNIEGVDLMYLGQNDAATAACQEAREIYADAGDRNSVGKQLNDCAVIRARQGDLEGARKIWEETLSEFRKTGNAQSTAAILNNLGIVNHQMGRLQEGLKLDLAAQPYYRDVGDQDGLARSIFEAGNVFASQGALRHAKENFEQALRTARAMNDDSLSGFALDGLGHVALYAGNLDDARKTFEESFRLRAKIDEKQTVAETQVHLGEVFIEQGQPSAAEKQIQDAMQEFQKEDDVDEQILAGATLAEAYLAEGKIPDALVAIGGCEKLAAKSVDLDSFFELGISAGSVYAAARQWDKSKERLRSTIEKASHMGYLHFEMEALLALGEVEMNSGQAAEGRALLVHLEKDATARGFLLIARKAHAAYANQKGATKKPG